MTLSLPWLLGAALLLIAVIGCIRLVRAHQRQPYLRTRLWLSPPPAPPPGRFPLAT